MLYRARISPEELALLARLQGSTLRAVQTGPMEVRLLLDFGTLEFNSEEIPTPDREHDTADVDLLRVHEVLTPAIKGDFDEQVWEGETEVRQIDVLRIILSFSPVIKMPPENLLGVTIPESLGYGCVYHRPNLDSAELKYIETADGERAFVDLDAGIEVTTSRNMAFVLYTWGDFVQVSISPEVPRESWYRDGLFIRHRVL